MKERKKSLTQEQIRKAGLYAAEKIAAMEIYRQAACIYGYMAYNREVPTLPLLRLALDQGKRVALPRLYGKQMRYHYVSDFQILVPDRFGIPTPPSYAPEAAEENALLLVPGLAFGRNGERIGYGGGYYDRYLSLHTKHRTIALCYDFMLVDILPAQPHDIPIEQVLSCPTIYEDFRETKGDSI